jgi:hypothetical protein
MVRLSEVLCGCQPRERRLYSDTPWSLHLSSFGGGVSVTAIYRELPPAVGALISAVACKSGSVGGDGSAVSTTASSVSQTHAYDEAIRALTASF